MANERRERRRERRQERREQRAQTAASMQINPPYESPYRNRTPQNLSHSQFGYGIQKLQDFNRGGTGFGAAALERARASGMSDQDVRNSLLYGGYNVGKTAFDQLHDGRGNFNVSNMYGRALLAPDSTVRFISGAGTENWDTDTLRHMQERRSAFEGVNRDLLKMQELEKARNWQPANSFAELGDQRWYSQPVTNDMRIAAANAVARSSRYSPSSRRGMPSTQKTSPFNTLGITL